MTYIDLSHTLENDMPVYPGSRPPAFSVAGTVAETGYKETFLQMLTHTGTHLDAPAHVYEAGKTLTELPVDIFAGTAFVANLSHLQAGDTITVAMLQGFAKQLSQHDYVVLNTAWGQRWGSAAYFEPFPVLSEDAARYLLNFKLKGIGLDYISVDAIGASKLVNHYILLGASLIIIENLANVDKLPEGTFELFAFPLKVTAGDGSPIRAVARIN